MKFFEGRESTRTMLGWCGLSHSSYYYRPKAKRPGRRPSTHTLLKDGSLVGNATVVIAIRFLLSEEFMIVTGYHNLTADLRAESFIINHKKVYRLMKENRLLCGAVIRGDGEKRRFVRWRVQQPVGPMEQLCMDIKYVYVHADRRNALLSTIQDVFTRKLLAQTIWWHMRKEQVIYLLHRVLQGNTTATTEITIRNDNGSQFIAHAVRECLKEVNVNQEFTHVATPEENSFIEAYHSILERQVLQNTEFSSMGHCMEVLERWKNFYNNRRRHGSLGRKTPQAIWDEHALPVEPLRHPSAAKPEQKSRPASEARQSSDGDAACMAFTFVEAGLTLLPAVQQTNPK
ncbi:MAG TPA: integrase core domain-containing protein [Lacibacter sp.]|nr:integrase core domain-containing protein [Lacibacter sp.]HMO88926.1 integrase core domain-containing protein [Lacibacter sp.]